MKTINIFKGQRIDDREIPESVTIIINEELPELILKDGKNRTAQDYLNKLDKQFNEQAEILSDILYHSLPGGTIERLIIMLLERRKSCFLIPFGNKNDD